MNRTAQILSPLLLASFLFSHCEIFFILARYVEKAAGQECVNPNCCCDHEGPEDSKAGCGMCYAAPNKFELLPADQCCLYPANCDPASGLSVLTVNKDIQPAGTVIGNFSFAVFSFLPNSENQIQIFDFKPAIFHPPQS